MRSVGKPVVMAKNTGFDEIITENNIGCLIDYTAEGFAKGLNSLVEQKDNWNSMSEKMKQLYNTQYSWTEMEKRIINLYSGI